jgi:phage terminase large subunit-like protein
MTNYILEYWDKIQSGEVVACRRLKQQISRLIEELKNPRDPWVFDLEKANRPIEFIENFCRLSVGSLGQKVKLDIWQKAIIQAVFGFVHKETGLRRIRELFILIGRKNGKTSLLAWISLYLLVADNEGGAEIYFLATKRDQARKGFIECSNVVSQSAGLRRHIRKRKSDLYFPLTFSKIEPLASESNSLDGLNSHGIIIDELHAIRDRNLYDVMKQSMSARQQPMLVMITTAGFVRECIFDSIFEYACDILDGKIEDERFLAFIYELDDRSEWTDFRMWEKPNPGLGTIKNYDDLAANVERAKNDSGFLPTLLTKDFNVRETVAGSWLTFEEANNEEVFDLEELRGCYGVGGVDLSATTDLTSSSIELMKPGSNKKYVISHSFMPADTLDQRAKEDKIPYDAWHKRGLITACAGYKVDYRYITDWFIKLKEEFGIIAYWVGYDSWNSPAWVEDMEMRIGYRNKDTLIPVSMGAKTLSGPMKNLKADLAAKDINYNNNPVLKWALTNVSMETDKNENIRPVKGRNQRQRIDPAVAVLISHTVLENNYEDYRGLIGW